MVASELISNMVPVLKGADRCSQALNWMEIFKVSHLPLTEGDVYLGLVAEELVYAHGDLDDCVKVLEVAAEGTFVYEDSHVYEVVRLACQGGLSVVPVLSREGGFVGSIVLADVLSGLSRLSGLEEPGAVVVLEVGRLDFSLSEVARIVEGNGAHVLSCCAQGMEDSSRVELTVKLDREDVGGVLDAFVRYGYVVRGCLGTGEEVRDEMEERYGLLMRYLSV